MLRVSYIGLAYSLIHVKVGKLLPSLAGLASHRKGIRKMEYLLIVTGLIAVAGVFAVIQKSNSKKPQKQVTRLGL
jgi:hypothetical protein